MTSRMNQEKIGKLIAKMRKQKGLTQRELGEMVGVGFRAVSKWERGLTMPDISIINELSEILGISSDELLNGELITKDDNQGISTSDINIIPSKKNGKIKVFLLLISILTIITIVLLLLSINNREKSVEYTIQSLNPNDYLVEGTLTTKGNHIIININKIEFQNYDFYKTIIKNYDYSIFFDEEFLFGINSENEYNTSNDNLSINKFSEKFAINFKSLNNQNNKQIENSIITIKLKLYKLDNTVINKNIEAIIKNNN